MGLRRRQVENLVLRGPIFYWRARIPRGLGAAGRNARLSLSLRLIGVRFDIDALTKNAHGKIHNLYSVDGRNAELDKAQYRSKKLDAKSVFVFDDLITRGDTLSRIALAVLEANPTSKVYGIALAKNESTAWCPNPDNAHIPKKWDTLWKQGEREAASA